MKNLKKAAVMFLIMIFSLLNLNAYAATNDVLKNQEFLADSTNVKVIGRTYFYKDALWFALSGAGAEFEFTGTKAEITMVGDYMTKSNDRARFAIYVNDKLVVDTMLSEEEKTYTVFESEEEETADVKIIKLSESANSTIGIKSINVISRDGIHPVKEKSHKIEFIGDSITCGYGVDAKNQGESFKTDTEDFSKTYAYKTAKALDADYSAVPFSGYGIISGYTSGAKNKEQLVSKYYEKVAFSYGRFDNTVDPASISWNFNNFKPDIIVINLGTNDSSYCKEDKDKQKEFIDGYVEFLKQVRSNNPKAKILCTLGTMGDSLYPAVMRASMIYSMRYCDKNVYAMKFDVQDMNDGLGADWHPSDLTHTKAATKLTNKIKELMNW